MVADILHTESLIQDFLQNESKKLTEQEQNELDIYKKIAIDIPVIYVGTGTCGVVAGADKTLEAIHNYVNGRQLDAEIIETGCIGLCSLEPIVDVQIPGKNRVSFVNITKEKVNELLDDVIHGLIPKQLVLGQYKNQTLKEWENIPFMDDHSFFSMQKRIVLKNCGIISPYDIKQYIALGGYKAFVKSIQNYTHEEVCTIVEKSGLRGRSGSGFLTGQKWKMALQTPSDQKYFVCNAEESDPGAFMDRTIIEGDPHRLIEGITIASYSIGASKAYIYIRSEYKTAIIRLKKAIKDANNYGILGTNIFNSGFNLDILLKIGPGAFVCGEETALINSIEGKRGMPKSKPPFPAQRGLYHKPTVVNNVETLANIYDIILHGPSEFRKIGTEKSSGTKVFSITGKIKYTGLVEVPMGTTLFDIIFKIAGGIPNDKQFKALHLGGPSGSMIKSEQLFTPVDYESLQKSGALMGSGGMLVIDEETCILDLVKFFMHYMSRQSCGKCIPCREGTQRLYEILNHITKRPSEEEGESSLDRFKGVMQLENLAAVMKDTSLCGLGQNAPNPVISTLKLFKEEYDEHIFERYCGAGTCRQLKEFKINVDACTGCSLCSKKCPEDAIIGSLKNPYFIVQDKCTGCGICYDTCKFNAVIVD